MTHETLFLMLLRTSLILAVATILIGVLLRVTRCRSAMIHRLAWFFVIAQGVLWIQYPLTVPSVTVSTKTMPGHIMSMGSLAYIDEDRGEVVILPIKTLQEELPDLYQDGQLHERPPEWFLKQHAHFRELPKSVDTVDENVETTREEETSEEYVVPQDQDSEDQSNHQSRDSHGAFTTLTRNGPWLFCVIWAVGMVVIILLRAVGYCRLLMLLRNAQEILPEQNRQWREIQAALGITADHRLQLLLTDQIGPGLVTRPSGAAVLVPQSLWEDASDFVREGVLRHELSHYRHRDGLKSLLFFLLVAVHWFNSFAWFAWRKFNAAAEWRCDLEAYGRDEDSLYRFAESMLALHKTTDRHVALLHGFKNRDLKERVQRLGEQRTYPKESRMKKASIITVAVLCLVFGAVKFVPVASSSANPADPIATDNAAMEAEPQVPGNADGPGFATLLAHGTVADEQGKPVVGAKIYVLSAKFIANETEQPIAISDADGRFSLPQNGSYHDTIIAENADRTLIGSCETKDKKFHIVMKPSRTITGRVLDGNGEPVAGAVVFGQLDYNEYGRTESGLDGKFAFPFPVDIPMETVVALKPGVGFDYIFTLEKPTSEECRRFGMSGDPSQRKKSDGPFLFVLEGARDIRFKIVDEAGCPLEGITIHPWVFTKPGQPDGLNMFCRDYLKRSNAQGEVVYDFIPTWLDSSLTFWLNSFNFEITSEQQPAIFQKRIDLPASEFGGEVVAIMQPAVRVRGTVRYPDGTPAHGWWLRAQGKSGQGGDGQYEQYGIDENGNYEVCMMPNTKVNLSLERPDGAWGETIAKDWAARTKILVETGNGPDVIEDFTLEKGIRVSGLCTAGDDRRPLALKPFNISPLLPEEEGKTVEERHLDSWWWVHTDEQGRYEFWATPGDYRLWFQYGAEPKDNIFLEEGKEIVVDFHVDTPEEEEITTLKGRVFIDGKPAKDVEINCATSEFRLWDEFNNLRINPKKTDENGGFEIPVGPASVYIRAMTADHLLGYVVKVSPKQEDVEIHLTPITTVLGRILDQKTGEPIPGLRVSYTTTIPDERFENMFTTGFLGSTVTDRDGLYRFQLAEGDTYWIDLEIPARGEICESGSCVNVSQQTRLGDVTPKIGKVVDLGTERISSTPSAKQELQWNFFDAYFTGLGNYGYEDRFRAVSQKCQRDGKNVLVIFAAVDAPKNEQPARDLYRPVAKPVAELVRLLHEEGDVFARTEHYYLVGVRTDKTIGNPSQVKPPYENAAIFAQVHGIDAKALEHLTLCVFDSSGKLLGVEYLAPNGLDDPTFDKAAIMRLLGQHAPTE